MQKKTVVLLCATRCHYNTNLNYSVSATFLAGTFYDAANNQLPSPRNGLYKDSHVGLARCK